MQPFLRVSGCCGSGSCSDSGCCSGSGCSAYPESCCAPCSGADCCCGCSAAEDAAGYSAGRCFCFYCLLRLVRVMFIICCEIIKGT